MTLPAGGARHPASDFTVHTGMHYITMDGKEVYKFATRVMTSSVKAVICVTTDKVYADKRATFGHLETDALGGADPVQAFGGWVPRLRRVN